MTSIEIYKERFVLLSEVLRHTHDAAYFSVGQRIMINQERANLLRCIVAEYNNQEAKWHYFVSDEIEAIIERVMFDHDFHRKEFSFENYINL